MRTRVCIVEAEQELRRRDVKPLYGRMRKVRLLLGVVGWCFEEKEC